MPKKIIAYVKNEHYTDVNMAVVGGSSVWYVKNFFMYSKHEDRNLHFHRLPMNEERRYVRE